MSFPSRVLNRLNIKRVVRVLFPLIVTAIFAKIVWPILHKIEFSLVLKQIQPRFIFLSFLAYLLGTLFRAWRFKELIFARQIYFRTIVAICWIHTMMIKIFPSYMGEFSYIYLLKSRKVKGTEAIFSLMIVRILDVFSIFTIFVASFLLVRSKLPGYALIVGLCGWIGFLVAIWLIFQKNSLNIGMEFQKEIPTTENRLKVIAKRFSCPLKKYFTNLPIRKYSFSRFIINKVIEIRGNFTMLKEKRLLNKMLLLSFLLFFFHLCSTVFLLYSINMRLPLKEMVFIYGFSWIGSVIPIRGVCNFGNLEGVWALSFFLLSLGTDQGLIAGLYVHLIAICFSLFFGLIGVGTLSKGGK